MSSQRQSFWKKQQCKLQRRAAGNVPYALPVKDENSEELVVSPGGKVEEDTSSDSCVGESESLKPRLVQCPKCQAILPEPESASPYFQCGGCSTVLQAKHGSSAPPLSRQSSAPTPPSNSKEGAHHERRRDSWSLLGVRGSSLPTSLRTKRMSSEEPRATGPKVAVELKRQSLEQLRIVDLATCSDTASSSVAAPELLETEIFQKSGDCSSTNTPALLERSGVPTTHVNAPSMRDDGEAGTSSHLLFLEAAKEMDVDMPRISASDEESGMEVTVFQGKGSEDSGTSVISPGGCEEVVRMLRISDSEDEAEDAVVGDAKVASSGLARDREVLGEAGSSCTVEVGAADEPDRIEEHRRLADVSSIGDGGDLQLCSVDLMPLADGEPGDDGPADAKALSDVAGDVPVATHVLVGSEAALAKESSACASDASAQDSQSWVEPEELEPSASQYEQASVEHLALYSGSAVSQASAHKSVGKEEDVDGALAPGRKERVLVGEGAHVDKPDVASPSGPSGEILAATMSQDLIVLAGEGPSTSARNLEGSDAGGLSRTVSEDEISLQQGEEKGSSRKMEGSGLSRTGSEEQFLRANEEKCSTRNVDGNGLSRTGSEEQFLQAGEQKGSSRNMDGSGLSRTGSEGFDSLPREFDVGSTLSSHNSRQSLEGDVYAPADVEEYVAVPASISQQEFLSDVSNWAAADIPRLLDVELAMPETAAPAAGMMGRKSREDFASDKDRSPSPNSVITVEVRPSPPDPSPTYPVPISPIERQLAVPFPTPIQSPRHTDAPPAGFEAHVLSVKSFSRKAQPPLEDPSIPPQSSSKVVRPTDSALLRVMEDERSTRAHARAGSEPDMLHLGQSLFEGEHDSGIAYGLGGGAGSDSDNEIPYAASALRGKAKRAGGGAPVGDVAAVPDYSPSKSARKVDGSDYPVPSMLPGSGMDALDPTSTGSMGGAAASSDAGSGDWQRSASRLEPPRRLFDRRRAAAIVLESNGDMETALSLLTAEIEGRRDSLYVDDDNYSEYSAASSSRGMGESVEAVKGPSGSKRAQQQEQQQHQPRPGIDRDRAAALLRNAGGDMEAALALLTVEIESGTVAPFAATPGPPAPLPTSSTSPPVQPLGTVPVPAFVPAAPTAGSGARGSRSKGSHKGEKKHGDGGGHAHGHGHGHGHGPWQKKLPGGEESSPSPPQSPIVRFFGLGMHAHAHAHAHAPAGEVAKGAGQPSAAPTKASSRRKSSLGRSKHEKKASVAIPTIPAVPEVGEQRCRG